MSTKGSPAINSSPVHPSVGTLIDGGSLKLVDVLGVGGYGVVYRAVDARQVSIPKSYAVKCLVSSGQQTPRQRQIHIREIALHQLASAHPGVVTLHRVVEEGNLTYIVMDYAPDHDLFTQILHSCRYLGDDILIKKIFLQLLEAVEYCHSLGIYHRDLKPENILCFDDGLRIAITDFGLATTDKVSDEFRTGSVYHMSPECQGGEFAPTGNYSPMFNDIWSLGIILLNLATGRNPWKSATAGDPTFQAYLRDPFHFLPSVLPISAEINSILVRMLEVDWRKRMTLRDVRRAIEGTGSFYSEGVIFEGSMARCPWEAGMEIDNASSESFPEDGPVSPTSSEFPQEIVDAHAPYRSHWSKDSRSEAAYSPLAEDMFGHQWTKTSSCGATWGAFETSALSSSDSEPDHFRMDLFNSTQSSDSPGSSLPTTPNSYDRSFDARIPQRPGVGMGLIINTNIPRPRIYDYETDNDGVIAATYSTHSSRMHTAIEYDPFSSLFYIGSPILYTPDKDKNLIVIPESAVTAIGEDKEMTSPSVWTCSSATEMSSPSSYADSIPPRPFHGGVDLQFRRSASPSPEPVEFQTWGLFPTLREETKVQSSSHTCLFIRSSPVEKSMPSQLHPPMPPSQTSRATPMKTTTSRLQQRSVASHSNTSIGHHHRALHKTLKVRVDAAATLQLSRLVHPFRGIKRLWTQLNRLTLGLHSQSQEEQPPQPLQQQQNQQQNKWSWRLGAGSVNGGFGALWKPATVATTPTTRTTVHGTLANFTVTSNNDNNKMNAFNHLSFTRVNNGLCADVFELHRLSASGRVLDL